jgi:hypothetical protein
MDVKISMTDNKTATIQLTSEPVFKAELPEKVVVLAPVFLWA